ncbi:MAG TPA: DUF504 domain-containing protein [Candidatus Nitrosopolaris sp.]|nr:DUF504 domain-containing protein [Candidatus Nitrosopolaris sp.]
MSRKGKLAEIFSKALYYDNPDLYSLNYRDLNKVVQVSLAEFLKVSENFQLIPASRILSVTKDGTVLYNKKSLNESGHKRRLRKKWKKL